MPSTVRVILSPGLSSIRAGDSLNTGCLNSGTAGTFYNNKTKLTSVYLVSIAGCQVTMDVLSKYCKTSILFITKNKPLLPERIHRCNNNLYHAFFTGY